MESIIENCKHDNTCYFDVFSTIKNTVFKGKNKVYKFARVLNSEIGLKSSVGDFSIVENCILQNKVQIQRYNHIIKSRIDDFSYTGMNTVVMNSTIKKYCSISWGVTIGPSNHDYNRLSTHSFLYDKYYQMLDVKTEMPYDRFEKPCLIGNDVWIGCNVTILRGVSVGDGAVIAAGSVVTKDIPPYAIAAGVPAKVIKYRFDDQMIEELIELKWWEFPEEIVKKYFSLFSKRLETIEIQKLKLIKKEL
jgi:virginiamycin A acetyltransferase